MNTSKKNNPLLKSASKLPRNLSLKKSNRSNPVLDDISNFSSGKIKHRKGTPRKVNNTSSHSRLDIKYSSYYVSFSFNRHFLYLEIFIQLNVIVMILKKLITHLMNILQHQI